MYPYCCWVLIMLCSNTADNTKGTIILVRYFVLARDGLQGRVGPAGNTVGIVTSWRCAINDHFLVDLKEDSRTRVNTPADGRWQHFSPSFFLGGEFVRCARGHMAVSRLRSTIPSTHPSLTSRMNEG